MKKLLAVLALALVVVSCGGGGGGSKYDFSGRWMFEERVTSDPQGWGASMGIPVGSVARWPMRIDQNGSTVVLRDEESGAIYQGTCDRKAKTFTASATYPGGLVITIAGHGDTKEIMSGTSRAQLGNYTLEGLWTAELINR